MNVELEHIWSRVLVELEHAVDEPTYRLWLEPLRALEISPERVVIAAPPHASQWIRARFGRLLQQSVEAVLGAGATVELADGASEQLSDTRACASKPSGDFGPLGNPKLTFEQFVIGDCNRLAHAASLAVAEMPAQAYNPLFLCGPPGVGKTHLMSSIANLMRSHDPTLNLRCTTGESFTNEFLQALGDRHTEGFKVRFRDIDVLLMDDVQFLQHKARTEEEFFHTFNALHDSGRQIVLTCDRSPASLDELEERLRERFESGLVADLNPPDAATRLAILRMRAHRDHIDIVDDGALSVIADRVAGNVRVLQGALIRVVAFSSLTGRAITAGLATEVLDGLYPHADAATPPSSAIEHIQAATCKHFGITRDELLSSARTTRITWPRQLAMYLARELTEESLLLIGKKFGGRDHTTVLYALRRAATRITTDPDALRSVETLRSQLALSTTTRAATPDRPA